MGTIRRLSASSLLLLGAVATVSCGDVGPIGHTGPGGSTGNPQPTPVVPAGPSLFVQDVKVERTSSSTELRGGAGAAQPNGDGALVRAFAIDEPGVSAETTVSRNESFVASLASPSTQMVHVELELDGVTSTPCSTPDFETRSDGTLGPLASPSCLSNDVAGALLIDYEPVADAATFTVKLTETCGEKQDIHVALHAGTRFRLQDAPTSIGAHETRSLSIVHPATDSSGEDVDLLVVTAAALGHVGGIPPEPAGAMVVSLPAVAH
jgi:hypothetical protein